MVTYPEQLAIRPLAGPFDGTLHVPGSKSITNRALIMGALADGKTKLKNALFSDDTVYMIRALKQLGIDVIENEEKATITIEGGSGTIQNPDESIYVGNSGTCVRFLTALVSLGNGGFLLDGNERMRQRPIDDLLKGLQDLGVHATTVYRNGCPPVRIQANGLQGGKTSMKGSISSQFISAILLSAPYAQDPVTITVDGVLVSKPYVLMTTRMMEKFGARATWHEDGTTILVDPSYKYTGEEYVIESDFSSASYFMAAAALTKSRITLDYFPRDSLQGDRMIAEILKEMGASVINRRDTLVVEGSERLDAIEIDMFDCSDLVPTVAVMAAFARGTTIISNVENVRVKESDRLSALTNELKKLGVPVQEWQDGLKITGLQEDTVRGLKGGHIETYDDHRIAMAFSIAGLIMRGIIIDKPSCVSKTFPDFFQQLARVTGGSEGQPGP